MQGQRRKDGANPAFQLQVWKYSFTQGYSRG